MPSWNEKPHVVPVVNVNLAKCDTPHLCAANAGEHVSVCAARPILIPCPIPSPVTFQVALGWTCDCHDREASTHLPRCPRTIVSVSCSISGSTWVKSKVAECDAADNLKDEALWTAIRSVEDLWALVKSLVLGASKVSEFPEPFRIVPAVSEMLIQRDAVYAAIAKLARTEATLEADLREVMSAVLGRPGGSLAPEHRDSAHYLQHWLSRLIEQVGVLGVP